MPLTASGQAMKDNPVGGNSPPSGFVRVMAGIEMLILTGIIYISSSVRTQELTMAEIKAATAAYQTAIAQIPALHVRVVALEKDVDANAADIEENKDDIRALENRVRPRPEATAKKGDFSL
jgi:hypothetical protein